jgi:hypothetical protein
MSEPSSESSFTTSQAAVVIQCFIMARRPCFSSRRLDTLGTHIVQWFSMWEDVQSKKKKSIWLSRLAYKVWVRMSLPTLDTNGHTSLHSSTVVYERNHTSVEEEEPIRHVKYFIRHTSYLHSWYDVPPTSLHQLWDVPLEYRIDAMLALVPCCPYPKEELLALMDMYGYKHTDEPFETTKRSVDGRTILERDWWITSTDIESHESTKCLLPFLSKPAETVLMRRVLAFMLKPRSIRTSFAIEAEVFSDDMYDQAMLRFLFDRAAYIMASLRELKQIRDPQARHRHLHMIYKLAHDRNHWFQQHVWAHLEDPQPQWWKRLTYYLFSRLTPLVELLLNLSFEKRIICHYGIKELWPSNVYIHLHDDLARIWWDACKAHITKLQSAAHEEGRTSLFDLLAHVRRCILNDVHCTDVWSEFLSMYMEEAVRVGRLDEACENLTLDFPHYVGVEPIIPKHCVMTHQHVAAYMMSNPCKNVEQLITRLKWVTGKYVAYSRETCRTIDVIGRSMEDMLLEAEDVLHRVEDSRAGRWQRIQHLCVDWVCESRLVHIMAMGTVHDDILECFDEHGNMNRTLLVRLKWLQGSSASWPEWMHVVARIAWRACMQRVRRLDAEWHTTARKAKVCFSMEDWDDWMPFMISTACDVRYEWPHDLMLRSLVRTVRVFLDFCEKPEHQRYMCQQRWLVVNEMCDSALRQWLIDLMTAPPEYAREDHDVAYDGWRSACVIRHLFHLHGRDVKQRFLENLTNVTMHRIMHDTFDGESFSDSDSDVRY